MRPLTIDMHRLEYALDGRDIAEYYRSGKRRNSRDLSR